MSSSSLEKIGAELRRGIVQIAALALLREPMHGYQLVKVLSGAGLDTEEGTLYPLLRRLEGQGLLRSEWDTEGARPRKIYTLSEDGHAALPKLEQTWRQINDSVETVLGTGLRASFDVDGPLMVKESS
jgi:PadR family transcriptional regulator PadR